MRILAIRPAYAVALTEKGILSGLKQPIYLSPKSPGGPPCVRPVAFAPTAPGTPLLIVEVSVDAPAHVPLVLTGAIADGSNKNTPLFTGDYVARDPSTPWQIPVALASDPDGFVGLHS